MKVVAIVQARMGSERLPGKVLKPFLGKPALGYLLDILRNVNNIDDMIIATTTLANDDAIERFCHDQHTKVLRGSVHDVLDRFRQAALATEADVIVRISGDSPLLDPRIVEQVIANHLTMGTDHTSNNLTRSYPRGIDIEVVNRSVLEQVWRTTADQDDREHVTLYIRDRKDEFNTFNVEAPTQLARPDIRITLDTESDYQLINTIYEHLYDNRPIALDEVIGFLNQHPDVLQLNANIEQKSTKGKVY